MAKGTEEQLDELHRLVTDDLTDRIKNGEEVVIGRGENAQVVKVKASAAIIAQAVKFLQAQGIEVSKSPKGKERLKGLLKVIPFPEADGDPEAVNE